MRGGDARFLVLALGILVVAGFYSSFLGSSQVTGQQVSDVPIPAPVPLAVPVPIPRDCVNSAAQIPVGDDGKTISKSFSFCGAIALSQEYFINKNLKISCQPNTKLVYAGDTPRQFNGFHILEEAQGVSITGCTFEGQFKVAIVNEGDNTNLVSDNFISTERAIHETDTATNAVYNHLVIDKNNGIGITLEGTDAVVKNSQITNNAVGIKIGKPMLFLPSAAAIVPPGTICSQNPAIPGQFACSDPESGENVQVLSSTFSNNNIGVEVNGLHVDIAQQNKFLNNNNGIFVSPLYIGSAYLPPPGTGVPSGLLDFFISDITIQDNDIKGNDGAGIVLSGHTTETAGAKFYGAVGSVPPSAFYATTDIKNNKIEENNQGIRLECPISSSFFLPIRSIGGTRGGMGWEEYSLIDNNGINLNSEGIAIDCGGDFLNVVNNQITKNLKNGIRVGYGDPDPAKTKCTASYNLLYNNDIIGNGLDGVRIECGFAFSTIRNKINKNTLAGFRQGPIQSAEYPPAFDIDCNDLSFNGEQGYYMNIQDGLITQWKASDLLSYFSRNRLIENGVSNNGDGATFAIRIPSSPGFVPYTIVPSYDVGPFIQLNKFENNQRYGLSLKGPFGAIIYANNFLQNNLGLVEDTGLNTYESFWDEGQWLRASGSSWPGSCISPTLTLVPCGNYFSGGIPPVYEVNVQKPPLLACSPPCTFSCYTAKNVCGDRDEITSPAPFIGHYNPEVVGNNCPVLSYGPLPRPSPFCGNGYVDPGEQCDPAAVPTGCPAGQTCGANCMCAGGEKRDIVLTSIGESRSTKEMYELSLERNLERRKKMVEEKYEQQVLKTNR